MRAEALHSAPLGYLRRDILGVAVTAIGGEEAMALLGERIAARRFTRIAFLNAHNANLAVGEEAFRSALGAFVVLADGIGVDIASRLLYGAPFPQNLNGTDFVPEFLRRQTVPLKVGLVGAHRRNGELARRKLQEIAPQHDFMFLRDGYFAADENGAVLDAIAAARPDVLLVAMGAPRQELWIARHITPAHCTVPIAVGALFDFLSGAVPRAPRMLRSWRFEWLFRLALEPRRLWRRYLLGNPVFLLRVMKQKLSGRGRPE